MTGRGELFDTDVPYAEAVARIAAHPAEWEPGTKAGYHPTSGLEDPRGRRRGRRRPADRAVPGRRGVRPGRPEGEPPRGAAGGAGRPRGPARARSPGRATPWPCRSTAGCGWSRTTSNEIHNEAWHVAKVEPGGGMRGPARELGRFYESLLGFGPPLLEPRTVEVMGAVHRYGLPDVIFGGQKTPWGLGVQVAGGMSGGPGRRAFGHGGMASSRGLADPDAGLVLVLVANGLARPASRTSGACSPSPTPSTGLRRRAAHLRILEPLSEAFRPSVGASEESFDGEAGPHPRDAGQRDGRPGRNPYRDGRASCDRLTGPSPPRRASGPPQPVRAARPGR